MHVDSIWRCSMWKCIGWGPPPAVSQTPLSCVLLDSVISLNSKHLQQLGKAAWGIFLQEEGKVSRNSFKKQRSLMPSSLPSTSLDARVLFYVIFLLCLSHLAIIILLLFFLIIPYSHTDLSSGRIVYA